MVIHTKQKAKLHVRAPKKATIKGNKTYTISRGPKIKSDAGVAVKKKNSSIKVAGAVGTQEALSHMEGGDEIRDATGIAYAATKPAAGVMSKGAELFKRKALAKKKSV